MNCTPKLSTFRVVILIFFTALLGSCGKSGGNLNLNNSDSSGSSDKFLKSLGFEAPYSSVGNAATPVLKVEVPNKLGILQLFSDSSCSNSNVVGYKYVDGTKDSIRVRLGNLPEGSISIYAKFTDKNLNESSCKKVQEYDLSNKS